MKKTWQWQYCGYAGKAEDQLKVHSGICDDDKGPHESGYNAGYCQAYKDEETGVVKTKFVSGDKCDSGDNINEVVPGPGATEWKGEYCGYAGKDVTETTLQTGACDDGKGPNSDSFGGGYCRATKPNAAGVSLTEYTTNFCGEDGGKPNAGEWKGEYCGYASATSASADKVYTGVCDDGIGPNSNGFEAGYCQGIQGSQKTEYTTDLCGDTKINEGSWKGEYCFSDNKVASCTGGYKANTERNSTDPFTVRCTFQGNFVCGDDTLKACDADGCEALGAGYRWDAAGYECRESSNLSSR